MDAERGGCSEVSHEEAHVSGAALGDLVPQCG
jgi:hypothetical protein